MPLALPILLLLLLPHTAAGSGSTAAARSSQQGTQEVQAGGCRGIPRHAAAGLQ